MGCSHSCRITQIPVCAGIFFFLFFFRFVMEFMITGFKLGPRQNAIGNSTLPKKISCKSCPVKKKYYTSSEKFISIIIAYEKTNQCVSLFPFIWPVDMYFWMDIFLPLVRISGNYNILLQRVLGWGCLRDGCHGWVHNEWCWFSSSSYSQRETLYHWHVHISPVNHLSRWRNVINSKNAQ